MKHVFSTVAVSLLATAAFAQTTNPGTTGTMAPPESSMGTGNMAKDAMGKDNMAAMNHDGMAMTQKNGKWYMGDRRATSAEIAEHKKMMKMNKPT